MLVLLLLSSLQVTKAARAAKEKTERCSLEQAKLGKGLPMLLLIYLLGWAMLMFVTVLLLLSMQLHHVWPCDLHNVLQG